MRKYTLANPQAKATVDLTDYSEVIANAVMDVMKDVDDLTVLVEKDCYFVTPSPSKGDAIRIGRIICKSVLGGYSIQMPKLFTSVLITEEVPNEDSEQPEFPNWDQ